jgi:hypothetical protein
MTNKLVVIIYSRDVQKLRKFYYMKWNFCTKLQLLPELLTRGLPPPDPHFLCPLYSTEFAGTSPPPPRTNFLGTPLLKYTAFCNVSNIGIPPRSVFGPVNDSYNEHKLALLLVFCTVRCTNETLFYLLDCLYWRIENVPYCSVTGYTTVFLKMNPRGRNM